MQISEYIGLFVLGIVIWLIVDDEFENTIKFIKRKLLKK
jgi:hypothetical protein